MQQTPKQNKTARKRIEEQRRERERWGREARDTKGQNFETSNNNAIYVCDAIAAVAAAVHHMHIAYKIIDEASFYCCSACGFGYTMELLPVKLLISMRRIQDITKILLSRVLRTELHC